MKELKEEPGLVEALRAELGVDVNVEKATSKGGLDALVLEIRTLRSELKDGLAEIKTLVRKLDG